MGRIRTAPKPLHFRYPEGDELRGTITKEHYEDYDDGRFIYRKFIQYVEFDDGEDCVRFTYYRKPKGGDDGSWVFGGQTSLLLQIDIFERLVKKAIEDGWIKVR